MVSEDHHAEALPSAKGIQGPSVKAEPICWSGSVGVDLVILRRGAPCRQLQAYTLLLGWDLGSRG